MKSRLLLFSLLLTINLKAFSQLVINEGSNRNYTQYLSASGEYEDWVEIYNSGADAVNLSGYYLSDDADQLMKWNFPSITIQPVEFLLIDASGNGSASVVQHWETAVYDTTVFSYFLPFAQISPDWYQPGFDASDWQVAAGGFGYGDDDDSTLIPAGSLSVYLLDTFFIPDVTKIAAAIFHMDYDDGFVAYLNGTEIARIGLTGNPPAWDELASDHEALMYQGQHPQMFQIDSSLLGGVLVNGTNVLAIEVHNSSAGSSDITARPFLTFGITDTSSFFGPVPNFFSMSSGNQLETNFKISSDGETIYLSEISTGVIDSLFIDNLELNYSTGKFPDAGNPQVFFQTSTPGSSNNSAAPFTGYEVAPEINPVAGFYEGPLTITISSSSTDAVIRYTTDGNEPDITSLIYNSSFVISSSQTVKARSFSTINLLPSITSTRTYFINEEFTLPVISISTDASNLYGYEGIYDNWWTDWKKPCYVEYFDQAQQMVFAQRSSIKIDGGAGGSRSQPQKSFRLDADHDVLGDGAFPYSIIPGRPDRNEYESVYLRNGSNQYLGLIYKDALATRIFRDTKTNYQEYRPVVAFLNGEYFGVYELREKQDEGYFKQNYQADPDELDILSQSYWYNGELRTLSGSADDFYTMQETIANGDPNDQYYYSQADSLLDLASYADYIIGETWIGNYDWPYNNIKIWRSHTTDNKWRFGLLDLELGLPPNGWSNVGDDLIAHALYYDPANLFVSPFQKLVQNTQFHNYFINRYADIMNSELHKDSVLPIAQQMYNELLPELPQHFLKWGDLVNTTIQQYLMNFNSYQADYMNALNKRSHYVRNHLVSNFGLIDTVSIELEVYPQGGGRILISTITPDSYPWKGIYFDGIPVNITAIPNPGYLFSNWLPNAFITDVNQQTTTCNVTAATLIGVNFTPTAPAQMIVSEFNYNSEASLDAGDWVELKNNGANAVDLGEWYVSDDDDLHRFTFPIGYLLQPGEYRILAEDTVKFLEQHPTVNVVAGQLQFGLNASEDKVRLFNNLDSAVVEISFTDSLPWPTGADGHGRTLELKEAATDFNDPSNWFDGCIGGSPGTSWSPCSEAVIISEINYNSSPFYTSDDWLELRNISNTAIDISNWQFKDDNDSNVFVLPSPTLLEPHSNLVLVASLNDFHSVFPSINNAIGDFEFNLSGSGEWLRFYNSQDELVISIDYSDTLPFPVEADGQGYTLELLDSTGKMNEGANWFAGCLKGSPGSYFFTPCEIATTSSPVVSENSVFFIYPNPANDEVTFEFPLLASSSKLTIYTLSGRPVKEIILDKYASSFKLDVNDYANGIYQCTIQSGDRMLHQKLTIIH